MISQNVKFVKKRNLKKKIFIWKNKKNLEDEDEELELLEDDEVDEYLLERLTEDPV